MSGAAQTATDNKSLPRTLASGGSVSIGTELKSSNLSAIGSRIRGKLRPLTTTIVYRSTTNGTASTFYAPVIPVEPASAAEFSSLITLYDECKVNGIKVAYSVEGNAALSTGTKSVVAYAPTDAVALASVVAGCEYQQHKLTSAASSSNTVAPLSVTSSGLWEFTPTLLKGASARSSATATNFEGEWSATSDTADTYGYLKWAIDAVGGVTITLDAVVYLTVSFRSRQ
jgi:hypothetical protein